MLLNSQNLSMVFTGFKASFQRGLGKAESQIDLIAMSVTSTTKEEKYGWLGKFPRIREWLGDRVIHKLTAHDYAIKNKSYEGTVSVDRDDIEDDTEGLYAPLFEELGEATAAHPDELGFGLLKAGFDASLGLAYDGQFFFDTDHPVLDENGVEISVANTDGGGGTAWFLMDLSRAMKPIIRQTRRPFNLVRKDKPDDDNVFDRKEFIYGVDGRMNVGFGLWQFAWGSKQTLNAANYKIARAALAEMKGDYGRPLGAKGTHLIGPPSLEGEMMEILNAERDTGGATNVWKGTATPVVVPWLA